LNPASKVLVTGCYAQVSAQDVAEVAGVDAVIGLNRLDDLLRIVEEPRATSVEVAVSDVKRERSVAVLGTRVLPGHTRAFLKVQEGCNYSCTYCIIPTARGLSRSVSPEAVLEQVRQLAGAGYREVVLTGIHLGGYGHDLLPKIDLAGLVERIAAARLIPRLRLSSLDPREVPDHLLDLIATSGVVCNHMHICAQAGDDGILRAMRRNYDTAYYRDLLMKVRERLPEAAIGSDIIVGFPGESDQSFERSFEFFSSVPLTYFHVFPYSRRRGTPAAVLPNALHPSVIGARARRMRTLGESKQAEFHQRFVGKTVSVLVEEKRDRRTGAQRGFSRNYLPVNIVCGAAEINREVAVRIDDYANGTLTGGMARFANASH
jgi:threonylcarbamoyladenosine tRNA methylthiotransferase MtaB